MKTLRGLDNRPASVTGLESKEAMTALPTFRILLKMSVGNVEAKDGNEAIDLVQIGLKLKVDGDVQLEDAEFKLLVTKVDKNEAKLLSNFHGQLFKMLKDLDKE